MSRTLQEPQISSKQVTLTYLSVYSIRTRFVMNMTPFSRVGGSYILKVKIRIERFLH